MIVWQEEFLGTVFLWERLTDGPIDKDGKSCPAGVRQNSLGATPYDGNPFGSLTSLWSTRTPSHRQHIDTIARHLPERIMTCMWKSTMAFCLPFLTVCAMAQQDKAKTPDFPSTDEIQLVVTQSERVFEQYKQTLTMEAELPTFKRDSSAIEKDTGVYDMGMTMVNALKKHPEAFHGVGGLLLLSTLDDASRNSALCSGTAYNDTMEALIGKSDVHPAENWMQVGLNCINVSGYLYTVSESVQALLIRDLKAQETLNQSAVETVNRCTAAMKKCVSQGK